MFNGIIFPESDGKIINGEGESRIADGTRLPGNAVNCVLLLRHLPEAEPGDKEQNAQMADPRTPEPDTVFDGEERGFSVLRPATHGSGHMKTTKDGFRIGNGRKRDVP